MSWNDPSYHNSLGVFINRLEEIPSLRHREGRRLCLEMLRDSLGIELVVEELPTTRAHLIGIVQACRRQHPRALRALIDVAEQMERDSIPVQRARAALQEVIALDLVPEHDHQELLALLGDSPIDQLTTFMRLAVGPAADVMPNQQHPAAMLAALERMNAGPDDVPPLLVFVEHIAAFFGGQRAEQLRRWNDAQAARIGLTEKLRTMRIEQDANPMPRHEVTTCLVIRIEPDLLDAKLFNMVHWRQHNTEWRPKRGKPYVGDLDAIRSQVADLVAEAETGWAKDASAIRIEFLLPYALVNLPVDQWDLEADSELPRLLGVHYQVIIRSLDRARSPKWHREWRQRWKILKQLPSGTPAPSDYWLWSPGKKKPRHLNVLDAKLAMHKEAVSLVLSSVQEDAERGELLVGVRAGVPVMIWHRADSARSAFEAEVKAMREKLSELVENFRRLRARARQAARPDSHVGSRISLLWDDPDRPVEPLDPPAVPIEEVPTQ